MIKVLVQRLSNENISFFSVSGHANYAGKGQDIVCAGVSAVVFGSVNSIMALTKYPVKVEQAAKDGGFFSCEIPKSEGDAYEKAQLLLEGMLVSLQTIERDYGSYIRVKEKISM